MSEVLFKLGLTREQVSSALGQAVLPARDTILVASAISLKGRQGRRGLPENLAKAMYEDYLQLKSLSAVGRKYGRSRQAVYDLFAGRGWKCYARNWLQRINYGGRVYTPGKNGYFRATSGDRRALHHQMWLDRGNIIPHGYQVSFADGDCTNFAKDNLFCDSLDAVTRHHLRRLGKIKSWTLEERKRRHCENAKACYQRKRVKFLAQGLTTTGKVRQRRENYVHATTSPVYVAEALRQRESDRREQVLASYHRRAERLVKAGLNTRGQSRTYRVRGKSELQKNYDAFRSTIVTEGRNWDEMSYATNR